MILRPMFSFFGSKWKMAKHYPEPLYDRIVEPFAGSAGYALHHHTCNVELWDADPVVCGVWDYLIRSSKRDILKLPLIDDPHWDARFHNLPQEAKWLVGFWLEKARPAPAVRASTWVLNPRLGRVFDFWGAGVRDRIARQVVHVKHWKIHHRFWHPGLRPKPNTTFFLDPPYEVNGHNYTFAFTQHRELGAWVRSAPRPTQIIVCEQYLKDHYPQWLPFEYLHSVNSAGNRQRTSHELMYHRSA